MIPMPGRDTPVWSDSEVLECVSVLPEAPGVKTFTFRPPSGATFVYRAGQFITLDLPVPGGNVQRTYTISSSPVTNAYISVTVKVQQDSVGTKWMLENLVPGMQIKAYGPAGLFHLPRNPDNKYLFISAGSGVTPMMSMATTLFERGEDPDICFIQCATRPVDLIFRKRLEYMASRVNGLQLHFVVTKSDPYEVWTGYRGHFNQLMLGLMCNDYLEREVYCCGPEGFMESVREILNSLGFNMENYFQESFQAPAETKAELTEFDDVVPQDDVQAQIVFANSKVSSWCSETDTVLAVAKDAGLNIPSGCTFGVCGTCKVKKLSGEVHMVHSGGISDEDIEAGFILACCSNPIGTVEVDI
ncbi:MULTISPECIES: hybrid-cluster NAD(P)-dependent oxidoreductase [Stappiaceae]|jgi:ferredoxin-NADP reductase|uniref:Stearoyl-CoA 9-desaturase electron transfer partner n=2 Tax=Roseibium TaxID=150830 RepID=A0A0M6XYU1_9HYPH|nr:MULTISPECIES: hybrid-cluster NAD(P)-dependent oxidoreductase [Stappiaceae]MEC9417250.1 hybrid-cluster NAD(P)-dependent oxidoreductase [Pseudomonadota bacterium]AMN53742.1 NADH oxidase [Labrenzia sp. CP4]AQQ06988.1 hybrid-cluster NAD(P)-dependent oxidoreductase [Roseibium aggregatum]ERP96943.1 dioxygenase [Labrenzia sp. C1B10]ERS04570.1 dioxygenase [Labrenzia sp. C1B70]